MWQGSQGTHQYLMVRGLVELFNFLPCGFFSPTLWSVLVSCCCNSLTFPGGLVSKATKSTEIGKMFPCCMPVGTVAPGLPLCETALMQSHPTSLIDSFVQILTCKVQSGTYKLYIIKYDLDFSGNSKDLELKRSFIVTKASGCF